MESKKTIIPAFFAENGLTATSANHLSNIAKENYMAIERQMRFVRNRPREVLPDKEMG